MKRLVHPDPGQNLNQIEIWMQMVMVSTVEAELRSRSCVMLHIRSGISPSSLSASSQDQDGFRDGILNRRRLEMREHSVQYAEDPFIVESQTKISPNRSL